MTNRSSTRGKSKGSPSPSRERGEGSEGPPLSKILCPLHGIRTEATWQRTLADLAIHKGWRCRLERWYFGRFSIFAFLTPLTRELMLTWLRVQYDNEINDKTSGLDEIAPPSVIAHSFGTYILGYALL